EGRTTGIAAVNRRIDLDEIVVGTGSDLATGRGDDTGSHRAAEAEGIADGYNPLTYSNRILREFDVGERLVRRDLQQSEVGAVVLADQLGVIFGAVGGYDRKVTRVIDDVVIGHHVAVSRNKEPRPQSH